MPSPIHHFGIVGLGKMGGAVALNAIDRGFAVSAFDTHPVSEEMQRAGVKPAANIEELVRQLPAPRLIILYVPAGPPVDGVLNQLFELLEAGDIIADGGNSYWGDSVPPHAQLVWGAAPPPPPPRGKGARHPFHRRGYVRWARRCARRRVHHGWRRR